MATISSTLDFQDNMSAAMKVISNRMDEAAASAKIAKYELEDLQNTERAAKAHLDALSNSTMKDTKAIKEAQKAWQEATKAVDEQTLKINKYNNVVLQNEIRLKKLEEQQKKTNNSLTIFGISLGNIIGNLAIRAFDGLKNSIGTAIQTASDLAEVQNVVDVAFGNSSGVINEWSKNTLDKFGLNELSAKRFVGTMGAMLKSSGMTGDTVMEMSTKIAELSGDMASFYNLDNEEAFAKIRAGISGVTMPLKQLGIDMSEANLSAFALGQGFKEPYNKMSETNKMMLRYQYLLNATKDAQGDFVRTQDSFANQQKLLGENWANLTSTIANLFIPALAKGMEIANGIIKSLTGLIDTLKVLSPIIALTATAILVTQIPALIALANQMIFTKIQAFLLSREMQMAAWNSIKAWASAAAPFLIIIGAITAVSLAMKALGVDFREQAENVLISINWIVNAVQNLIIRFENLGIAIHNAFSKDKWDYKELKANDLYTNTQRAQNQMNKITGGINAGKSAFNSALGGKNAGLDGLTTNTSGGKALKTQNQGDINIKEDDIELLHDLATKDYAQYFQQLTPNLTIPNMVIHETADVNQVIGAVANAITGSISSSTQGGYATA